MPAPLTLGSCCRVVLLVAGSRIDLPEVEGFSAAQVVVRTPHAPLNGDAVELVAVTGWRGAFEIARGGPAVDDLFARLEALQFTAGVPQGAIQSPFGPSGSVGVTSTLYQYVTEPDGSLSTFEFTGASLVLEDAGRYRAGEVVRQRISFFAGRRNRL